MVVPRPSSHWQCPTTRRVGLYKCSSLWAVPRLVLTTGLQSGLKSALDATNPLWASRPRNVHLLIYFLADALRLGLQESKELVSTGSRIFSLHLVEVHADYMVHLSLGMHRCVAEDAFHQGCRFSQHDTSNSSSTNGRKGIERRVSINTVLGHEGHVQTFETGIRTF
jgi:hypothetical protein